jgi:hypothetical protein
MTGMGLVQHHAEVGETAGVPAEVAVVADRVGHADNLVPRCDPRNVGPSVRRNIDFATIGERRGARRIFRPGERVERFQQLGRPARAFDLGRREIDLVGYRPDRDGGMVVVLPDQLEQLLAGVRRQGGIRR